MATAKTTAKKHGGVRANSGIKPADGAKGLKRVNITIDPISDAIAHEFGLKEDGSSDRSLGIRRALAIAKAHQQSDGNPGAT